MATFEIVAMFHVPPIDPKLFDIVPARVAASLQANFERDYRAARRDKVRTERERKQRGDVQLRRMKFADER